VSVKPEPSRLLIPYTSWLSGIAGERYSGLLTEMGNRYIGWTIWDLLFGIEKFPTPNLLIMYIAIGSAHGKPFERDA